VRRKASIPKTLTRYNKRYEYHGHYPSRAVADSHAVYLQAGALFQGTFKTHIKQIGDDFVVYKRRVRGKK